METEYALSALGVVTAPGENSESGANPERYRHCKRGGVPAKMKVGHWREAEKAAGTLRRRKSGELLK